jgi:hypothetical protein
MMDADRSHPWHEARGGIWELAGLASCSLNRIRYRSPVTLGGFMAPTALTYKTLAFEISGGAAERDAAPSMKEFIAGGIDLGKNYFQIHAAESEDELAMARKLRRGNMQGFSIDYALPGRHGGLWLGTLLGARTHGLLAAENEREELRIMNEKDSNNQERERPAYGARLYKLIASSFSI